ncbi:MAG: YicC/YloC family endoribonuclease [candidate division WOR-3 bacterium]
MIKSMTGYGRAEAVIGEDTLTVEIKSTNHRYCEVSLHVSPKFSLCEREIKKLVLSKVNRGRLDVFIQCTNEKAGGLAVEVDFNLARRLIFLLRQLKEDLQLSGEITLDTILPYKELILTQPPSQAEVPRWEVLQGPLTAALESLLEMRREEGRLLKEDFSLRLGEIEKLLEEISTFSYGSEQVRYQALKEKIFALSRDIEIDEARLAQEAAHLAEKSDITEEMVRVQSHLRQFKVWLDSEEPVGRRLDFLIQEIHREVNTIGSKSCQAEISLKVVEIKNELEKLREQVQNVE